MIKNSLIILNSRFGEAVLSYGIGSYYISGLKGEVKVWVNKFIILLVVTIFFTILIHSPASAREILVGNSGSGADFPGLFQEAR